MKTTNTDIGVCPYAFIEKDGVTTFYEGKIHRLDTLQELEELKNKTGRKIVFQIPFRTIKERGEEYKAQGDEPIIAMEISSESIYKKRDDIKAILGNKKIVLDGEITPSMSDEDYAAEVADLKKRFIDEGKGTQIIFSRKFQGKIADYSPDTLFALYKQIFDQRGQYMSVLFNSGESAIVAATPERHLEISESTVTMNPIAGTIPKKDIETFEKRLFKFLEDKKEINELYQVLDEELKMMASICPDGGKIEGPFLRETGAVIHTEYLLVGKKREIDAVIALKHTLHAPTLVGGPLASASREIARSEDSSRRYYGGEIGILEPNGNLDSAICIRAAEVFNDGRFTVQAGAGIVKDSVPEKEAQETTAKAEGMLKVIRGEASVTDGYLETVDQNKLRSKLSERNKYLSKFHFEDQSGLEPCEKLKGTKITIINNEDNFAFMLGHMTKYMGCEVNAVDSADYNFNEDDSDIVIIGPGPGDINDQECPRMRKVREIASNLNSNNKPVLGICLGHQALAQQQGMDIVKLNEPMQGLQREVNLIGSRQRLGFYNSYVAKQKDIEGMEYSLDDDGNVIAIHKDNMIGFQFHPESVMSQNGYNILKDALLKLKK